MDAKEMDKTLVQWEKDERAQVTLQRAAPALEAWEAAVSEECQGYVIAGGGSMKAAAGGGGKKKRKVEEDAEEEDEWGDGAAAEGKGKKNAKKGGGKKRNAAADEEEDGGDEEEGDTVDAVRAQIADGSIHGLTVPELKVLCRKLGLPVSGKKADLVTRLQH